jgi:hypothetical protein
MSKKALHKQDFYMPIKSYCFLLIKNKHAY